MKIKYEIEGFFRYTIPEKFDRTVEFIKDKPVLSFGIIITTLILGLGVYEGIMSNRYQNLEKQKEQIKKDPYNVVRDGPVKYLEEQLDVKNEKELVRLFNNSAKYQNQLENIVAKAETMKSTSKLQDYLNPIIDEIKNGTLVNQETTGLNFSDKPIYLEDSDAVEGVVQILIDSRNNKEVMKVKEIMRKPHDYRVVVYDSNSMNGKDNYNGTRNQYLFSQDYERKGYNSNNDWTGKMYGFNDALFVWRSNSLTDLPKTLPSEGLQGEK